MKVRIKSVVLCTLMTLFSLAVMRYGNDGGYLPAADYTESAQAVFFMFDENAGSSSAISYFSAGNILNLQSESEYTVQTDIHEQMSDIEHAATEILPPVITPPKSGIEVFGSDD